MRPFQQFDQSADIQEEEDVRWLSRGKPHLLYRGLEAHLIYHVSTPVRPCDSLTAPLQKDQPQRGIAMWGAGGRGGWWGGGAEPPPGWVGDGTICPLGGIFSMFSSNGEGSDALIFHNGSADVEYRVQRSDKTFGVESK